MKLMPHSSLLITLLLLLPSVSAQNVPDPGQQEVVTYPAPAGMVDISFRYCPEGTIIPGQPDKIDPATKPVPLDGFFMSETEITVSQFRTILGQEGLTAPLQFATEQSSNPALLAALQSGQQEPMIFADLGLCVSFCQALEKLYESAQQNTQSIETRQFRLPSHLEWQYAARAIADSARQSELPHFNRWPKFDELETGTQERCREVWAKLGRRGAFTGAQGDYLAINEVNGADEQQKVDVVLREAFRLALEKQDRTTAGTGTLGPVAANEPNQWHLHDFHSSVTEWALNVPDPKQIRNEWSRLIKEVSDLANYENALLAGGSIAEVYSSRGQLPKFTIWGATPVAPGDANAWKLVVEDKMPGFRIVMTRRLVDGWLFVVRQGVRTGTQLSPNAQQFMVQINTSVADLTADDDPARQIARFYTTLARWTPGNDDPLKAELTELTEKPIAKAEAKGNSAASRITSLIGGSSKKKEDAKTDEQLYFEMLANNL